MNDRLTVPEVQGPSESPPLWTQENLDLAELATLRRGWGVDPGAVPAMWRHYRNLSPSGEITRKLRAEHIALTIFALHQQGATRRKHASGVSLGRALRVLRNSDSFSQQAVDRRVTACATATDVNEVAHHLRALISMLKTLENDPGLDYTQLLHDLTDWQSPTEIGRVRRRFARDYYASSASGSTTSTNARAAN